jgi:protease secretion system outer membrane protein
MNHREWRWWGLTVLCAGIALPSAASAFDLLDAYRLAVAGDANFLAARATADAAREALPQAKAGLLPQISLSANRNHYDTDQTSIDSLRRERTIEYEYWGKNGALSLRQPLFRLGNVANYFQAEASVAGAEATLEKHTQNLALRLAGAYFDVLAAIDKLDTVRTQKAAYAGQLTASERAFETGFGTRTDIDDVRARFDMAVAQEIDAAHGLGVTERALAGVLNQRVKSETLARIDATRLRLDLPQPRDLDAWLSLAEQQNPELRAILSNIEVAEREVDKARAAHLPTLDLVASRSLSDSADNSTYGSKYWTTSFGVQLNVPLYAGGQTSSAVRQAQANLERARQEYEGGRRQLEVEVAKEFGVVEQGVARVKALEQALRSAEQALLSSRKGVMAGTRNSVDVLNALQQLSSARLDLSKARSDYAIGRLKLKIAAGMLNEDDVIEVNSWLKPAALLAGEDRK